MNILLTFVAIVCITFTGIVVKCSAIDVNTTSGLVRGQTVSVLDRTVTQFLGIPFAEPPVGQLRFAKPKPITRPLPGVIDATKRKSYCMQAKSGVSEDCLFLNIWTRDVKPTKLKPVMFWIHGGGLSFGSAMESQYDGGVLATQDVVFVSTNYRLGTFGFFYSNDSTTPGNVGFYDQTLALKWVRDNIHLFGGDKNEITIFGESAGSWSVSAHIISPESKGLFKRAIMESGSLVFDKNRFQVTKDDAYRMNEVMIKHLNCSASDSLKCLRSVSAQRLLEANSLIFEIGLTFPVVGTEFLPLSPQQAFKEGKYYKDIELLAGVTKNEGSIFVYSINSTWAYKELTADDFDEYQKAAKRIFHDSNMLDGKSFYLKNVDPNNHTAIKWKMFDSFGDLALKCPTYFYAKLYAQHQTNPNDTRVYFYEITHSSNGKPFEDALGVTHGADVPFVFGGPLLAVNSPKEDKELSKRMIKYWVDFATNGKPSNDWPAMVNKQNISVRTLNLDENAPPSSFYEVCEDFWKTYFV